MKMKFNRIVENSCVNWLESSMFRRVLPLVVCSSTWMPKGLPVEHPAGPAQHHQLGELLKN